jgi:hypothetical protein
MSTDQPRQSGTNQTPQEASSGNVDIKNPLSEESALVSLYRNITQETESQARNVLMFVVRDDEEANARQPNRPT